MKQEQRNLPYVAACCTHVRIKIGAAFLMRSALKRVNPTDALAWSEQAEAEFAKDIWDARNLPGVHYSDHYSTPLLNFTQIPECFRPTVKQFLRFLLTMQSHATGVNYPLQLRYFLLFFVERYPQVYDFYALTAQDMDAYVGYLRYCCCRNSRSSVPCTGLIILILQEALEAIGPFKSSALPMPNNRQVSLSLMSKWNFTSASMRQIGVSFLSHINWRRTVNRTITIAIGLSVVF